MAVKKKSRKLTRDELRRKFVKVLDLVQYVYSEEMTDEQRSVEDTYLVGINEGRVALASEILEILV